MNLQFTVCIALALSLLSGCGTAIKKMNDENAFLVSAEDIDTATLITACSSPNTEQDKKNCIGTIASNSQLKCSQFLNGLVLAENTSNTGFDFATILLSALATVLTPLNTVHALTAGASVSSGWKAAVNSNIYAKASIGNYAQAIQGTYYRDLREYWTALAAMKNDQIIVAIEAAKIQSIHRECSLASAQATISATLQPTPPAGADVYALTNLTIAGTLTVGETLNLIASAPALAVPVVVPYKVEPGDDEKKLAAAFLKGVNENATLKAAKITAVATDPPSGKIVLRSPANLNVVWTPSNPKVMTVTSGGTSSASVGASAGGDTSSGTKGAEPGHRIQ